MDDYSEKEWPLGYAIYCSPSVKKEFARGMTIFAYMRYDEVRSWETSFNTVSSKQNRGEEYEAFKKRKTEQLLNRVEEKFPGVKKIHIAYLYIYTANVSVIILEMKMAIYMERPKITVTRWAPSFLPKPGYRIFFSPDNT